MIKNQIVQRRLIAISGKISSGKDTVGIALMNRLGYYDNDYYHIAYADALKREISEIVEIVRLTQQENEEQVLAALRVNHHFPELFPNEIAEITEILWDEVKEGKIVDGFTRSNGTRIAQQHWGTGVRRKYEPDYWVNRLVEKAQAQLELGKYVINTDLRFPNEADAIIDNGGLIIRLDVDREIQAQRLLERDGIVLTKEREDHTSETGLDDYDEFAIRIDNSYISPEEIVDIILAEIPQLLK